MLCFCREDASVVECFLSGECAHTQNERKRKSEAAGAKNQTECYYSVKWWMISRMIASESITHPNSGLRKLTYHRGLILMVKYVQIWSICPDFLSRGPHFRQSFLVATIIKRTAFCRSSFEVQNFLLLSFFAVVFKLEQTDRHKTKCENSVFFLDFYSCARSYWYVRDILIEMSKNTKGTAVTSDVATISATRNIWPEHVQKSTTKYLTVCVDKHPVCSSCWLTYFWQQSCRLLGMLHLLPQQESLKHFYVFGHSEWTCRVRV